MVKCPECDSEKVVKNGKQGFSQKYKCKDCGNNFIDTPTDAEAVKKEDAEVKKEIEAASEKHPKEVDENGKRILSTKPKNAGFRLKYRDKFVDGPKFSKKYGFEFESWHEYFAKKHEAATLMKPTAEKKVPKGENPSAKADETAA